MAQSSVTALEPSSEATARVRVLLEGARWRLVGHGRENGAEYLYLSFVGMLVLPLLNITVVEADRATTARTAAA